MAQITAQEVTNKKEWEQFILSHPEANFLSSWNWIEYNRKLGKKVFPVGLFQNKKLVGALLFIKEESRRGNYLTIAGGPILNWEDKVVVEAFVNESKRIGKLEQCVFLRVRPQIEDTETNRSLFQENGFREAPMHITADLTLQLDLDLSEEELLMQMRKTTRYEIRKADRVGVEVVQSRDPSDIKEFHKYHLWLAQKHNFVPFSYEMFYKQFETFVNDDQVVLFHAYKHKKLLDTAFIMFYGKEAAYHYGISTPENRGLPGSYACQWEAIKEAKKRGMTRYNFWGIAPLDKPNHRYAGLSVFKRGFGGREVAYLPAHDLPLSPLYTVVNLFETFRAKRRKLA